MLDGGTVRFFIHSTKSIISGAEITIAFDFNYHKWYDACCGTVSDCDKKVKVAHTRTERRVPELIPVLGSQPAGDGSHKPADRLPLLFARPAVTPATLKRAATNFADW